MKQNVIIYLLFSLFVLLVSWEEQSALAVATFHQEVKTEDAIRLRILANSDSVRDQALKRDIRDKVNIIITTWITEVEDLEEATATIKQNIPMIEELIAHELNKLGLKQSFKVDFSNVEFPTKLYGNIVYPAGMYNAVVITLGEGKGENWWCVLFPPLCFLEIANEGERSEEQSEEIEVSFFIVELLSTFMERFFSSEKV